MEMTFSPLNIGLALSDYCTIHLTSLGNIKELYHPWHIPISNSIFLISFLKINSKLSQNML